MEKKKVKLKLDEIKVVSFVTSPEGLAIQGGNTEYSYCSAGPGQCYEPPSTTPPYSCNTSPYPCQSDGGSSGSNGTQQGGGQGTNGAATCASCQGMNTCQATCNYTNYGSCTCAPATAQYTGCYC